MQFSISNPASKAIIGIYTLLLSIVIIACLYFGQAIFIPIALAALLSFFLSRPVTLLEKWIGRVPSVLLLVILVFVLISSISYIMTHQVIDLAVKLPNYKTNIQNKIHSLHIPEGGGFTRLSETIEDLKNQFMDEVLPSKGAPLPSPKIQVIETPIGLGGIAEMFLGVFFKVIGTTGFVFLLVFFMLINREDLQDRITRLLGQGRIVSATRAMNDASSRISQYLLMFLIVNTIFGFLVALGLYLLGIPNAVLWGGMALILRFIPYVGAWIAASIPVLLSIAVSTSWTIPIMTIGLFLILELIIANVVEPLLYGSGTGVSPFALIMAAVFWTWLWGPIGLVVSTPLTVCLVVMGNHVTKLGFLRILLSNEKPPTYEEESYNRILQDPSEGMMFLEKYLKTNSLQELYDQVLIPVLSLGEKNVRSWEIEPEQGETLRQNIREIISDLYTPEDQLVNNEAQKQIAEAKSIDEPAACQLLCLPARAERDEIAGAMLVHLLDDKFFECENVSSQLNQNELIAFTEKRAPDIVCISAVHPSTIIHTRYLTVKLRARNPAVKIIVGLWGTPKLPSATIEQLRAAGADEVVFSLTEAVSLLEEKFRKKSAE